MMRRSGSLNRLPANAGRAAADPVVQSPPVVPTTGRLASGKRPSGVPHEICACGAKLLFPGGLQERTCWSCGAEVLLSAASTSFPSLPSIKTIDPRMLNGRPPPLPPPREPPSGSSFSEPQGDEAWFGQSRAGWPGLGTTNGMDLYRMSPDWRPEFSAATSTVARNPSRPAYLPAPIPCVETIKRVSAPNGLSGPVLSGLPLMMIALNICLVGVILGSICDIIPGLGIKVVPSVTWQGLNQQTQQLTLDLQAATKANAELLDRTRSVGSHDGTPQIAVELEAATKANVELQERLRQAYAQMDSSRSSAQQKTLDLEAATQANAALSERMLGMDAEANLAKNRTLQLVSDLQAATKANAELVEKLHRADAQAAEAVNKLQQMTSDLDSAAKANSNLAVKLDSADIQAASAPNSLQQMEFELDEAKRANADLRRKSKSGHSPQGALASDLATETHVSLAAQLSEAVEEAANAGNRLQQMALDLEAARQNNTALVEQLLSSYAEAGSAQRRVLQLTSDLEATEHTNAALLEQVRQADVQIDSERSGREQLASKLALEQETRTHLAEKLTQSNAQEAHQRHIMQKLATDLDAATHANAALLDEMQKVNTQVDSARNHMQEMASELHLVRLARADLQKKLRRAEAHHKHRMQPMASELEAARRSSRKAVERCVQATGARNTTLERRSSKRALVEQQLWKFESNGQGCGSTGRLMRPMSIGVEASMQTEGCLLERMWRCSEDALSTVRDASAVRSAEEILREEVDDLQRRLGELRASCGVQHGEEDLLRPLRQELVRGFIALLDALALTNMVAYAFRVGAVNLGFSLMLGVSALITASCLLYKVFRTGLPRLARHISAGGAPTPLAGGGMPHGLPATSPWQCNTKRLLRVASGVVGCVFIAVFGSRWHEDSSLGVSATLLGSSTAFAVWHWASQDTKKTRSSLPVELPRSAKVEGVARIIPVAELSTVSAQSQEVGLALPAHATALREERAPSIGVGWCPERHNLASMDEPEEEDSAGERDRQPEDWCAEDDLWELEWSKVKFPFGSVQGVQAMQALGQLDANHSRLGPCVGIRPSLGHGSMMTSMGVRLGR